VEEEDSSVFFSSLVSFVSSDSPSKSEEVISLRTNLSLSTSYTKKE
jgi:hypothetical protein